MSAPENRAAYVAALRAIADAVEADETLPVPHGYLTTFPKGEAAVRFLRAVPQLPWTADQPDLTGGGHVALRGEVGDYSSDGIRIIVFADPEDVAREVTPAVPATYEIKPEIAALLAEPMRDES
jgi:hypothetical protein